MDKEPTISKYSRVRVISGEANFRGTVDEVEWDFDQWSYKVEEEWYCASEVEQVKWKRSDVTTIQVLSACFLFHSGDIKKNPCSFLISHLHAPYKVALAAMEREELRGYIEYGTSIRSAWVTELGEAFMLQAEASSKKEGWMKSTKAMEIEGVGCVVQVTTQQGDNVAESTSFVPGVMISVIADRKTHKVISRSLVSIWPIQSPNPEN